MAVADAALAAEPDPVAGAELAASASMVHSMAGRSGRCRDLFLAAEAASRHLPATDRVAGRVRRQVLPYAYLALGHPDDLVARARAADELVTAGEESGDAEAAWEGWHLKVSVALLTGVAPASRRHAVDRLAALTAVVGDAGRRWSMAYTRAAVAHLEGRLAEAEAASEEALEVAAGIAESRAVAVHGGLLLDVRRAQGRLSELAGLLDAVAAQQPGVAAWRGAAALALLAPGESRDPDAARTHLHALLADGVGALQHDFTTTAALATAARSLAALAEADPAAAASLRGRAADVDGALAASDGLWVWQGTCTYGPVALARAHCARARGDDATDRLRAAREQAGAAGADLFAAEADALLAAW